MDEYMDWVFEVQTRRIGKKLESQPSLEQLREQLEDGQVLAATTYYDGFTHVDIIRGDDDWKNVMENHEEHAFIMRNLGYYALGPDEVYKPESKLADKS